MSNSEPSQNVRIALVDRYSLSRIWYTYKLSGALLRYLRHVFLYGPKKTSRTHLDYKYVWSKYLYPLEITINAIKDRLHIVHIQYELVTFEKIYLSPLVIPLILFLRIAGKKVVITLHGPIFGRKSNIKLFGTLIPQNIPIPTFLAKYLVAILYLLICKLSHTVIVHAECFKKDLDEWGIRNVSVIPHGVSINFNYNRDPAVSGDLTEEKKVILYFGVLSPRKGLENLIKAFSLASKVNKECELLIAGPESPYYPGCRSKLQDLCSELEIIGKIKFLGYVSDEQLEHLFKTATIIVFPYRFSEAASGPLSLAMKYRKPVIATKIPYFSEVLGEQFEDILVPPDSVFSLADAISRILGHNRLRKNLQTKIEQRALSYSWDIVAHKTIQLYINLLLNDNP